MRPDYEKDYSLISLDSHELAAINHDLEATPGRDSRIEFIASPLQKALGIRTLEYMLLMLLVSLLSGSLDPAVIQARFLSSYYYFAIVIVVEAGFLITTEILDRHFHRLSYKITARGTSLILSIYSTAHVPRSHRDLHGSLLDHMDHLRYWFHIRNGPRQAELASEIEQEKF
eukprot:TRINITY_DN7371_c0_g1_i5.p2 TRINITY_DN7371_c0_g1~~TRINITY_DN7371_c0_g1_i5.p2  ORF type:complete len:172 (-),score=7.58 TRINITY_DN7371_c0_g1_i5:597-1112(-)